MGDESFSKSSQQSKKHLARFAVRILGEYLDRYISSPVRIVGTVSSINQTNSTFVLQTSDQVMVTIEMSDNEEREALSNGQVIELVGFIKGHDEVKEYYSSSMTNLDLDTYNEMVRFTHRFPELFDTRNE